MQFEVEKSETNPALRRVNVVPSHPDGVFVFCHYHYGIRAAGKIGLAGLDKTDVDRVANGEVTPKDLFMMGPDSHTFIPVEGAFVPVATIDIPGPVNSATVALEHFQEMTPVELQ